MNASCWATAPAQMARWAEWWVACGQRVESHRASSDWPGIMFGAHTELRRTGHYAHLLGLRRLHGQPDRPDTLHLKAQRVSGQAHLPAESGGLLASEQPSEAFSGGFSHLLLLEAFWIKG
jgi:hypothetical protein